MSETSPCHLNTLVADWVTHHPRTARVFEEFEIDYCCGGGIPLAEACRQRELDSAQILARLHDAVEEGGPQLETNWMELPLAELCNHIEQTHHAYLHSELPRLSDLVDKVVNVHGGNHPELAELRQVYAALRAELEPHMFKEERVLFPAIRQLEQSAAAPAFPFGTVTNPIGMMEHEHDDAGNALARIRTLTGGFQPPADACNTYRALLDGLRQLEQDTHQHVHKENNILFPRAIGLEESLRN